MPPTLSWLPSANDPATGNPLSHLPYSSFLTPDGRQHLCTAIGDQLLDLTELPGLPQELKAALARPTLNPFLALGPPAWQTLRTLLTELLAETAPPSQRDRLIPALHPIASATLVKPLEIPNYTDFYASIHHATRVGHIFRPDQPLLPNYVHIPIGYHGRASSITISGTSVRRPWGQIRPKGQGESPTFAPTAALDFELELAFVVGTSNPLGTPVSILEAESHLFGVTLLNDWSARDLQSWEYQPLGPFLGKSFATTISPWITPLAALEPFLVPLADRPPGTPPPLDYLGSPGKTIDVKLDVFLLSNGKESKLTTSYLRDLFWSPAQLVTHHTSNGCNLQSGDLLATGTISGPEASAAGCLLEMTRNGAQPLLLPNGLTRTWLEDGDQIILKGVCQSPGRAPIRLGECRATILPALPR